jgi:hypothetical protein
MHLSMSTLIVWGLISLIGVALLLYGKKQVRVPHMVGGAILIIFPYFVGLWWLALLIAAVVLIALAIVSRLGY